MKTVYLYFKDDEGQKTQTFVACSLKTGVVDQLFDLAEEAEKLDLDNITIPEVRTFFRELKNLILRVFSYKFSLEELNDNVEQADLMIVFDDLCESIGSSMRKN